MKKGVFVVFLFTVVFVTASTQTTSMFTIDGNGAITSYTGPGGALMIPDVINGIRVRYIGSGVFKEKNITSVVIPNGIIAIGEDAFSGNQLTSVVLPSSVREIYSYAFTGNQLTNVVFPIGLNVIGEMAFAVNQLTSITLLEGVTEIYSTAFASNPLVSVTIPSSISEIGAFAFVSNVLSVVTIGNNVKFLGENGISFDGSFDVFYSRNSRKAGTYRKSPGTGVWSWSAQSP